MSEMAYVHLKWYSRLTTEKTKILQNVSLCNFKITTDIESEEMSVKSFSDNL